MGALVGDGGRHWQGGGYQRAQTPLSESLVPSEHPPAGGVGRGTLNQLGQ